MGFVFFFFFSLQGGQTWIGAGLLQSTSIQIPQWNLCGASRVKSTDPRRPWLARIRSPFHHLTLFEMSESYFTHYVNTSEPWNEHVRRQGRWMCVASLSLSLSPSPSLSLPLSLSLAETNECQFCGGAWGMCCALHSVVNQPFLKSLWRRGASGSPHRITEAWTYCAVSNSTPPRSPAVYTAKNISLASSWTAFS